jgi:regulator of protease activity HflC (stomatin/prohibitin superfamily)
VREVNYKPPSSSSVFRLGTWLLGGLVLVYLAFSSWYIVDQGERAVVLRLGATVGEAGPGPHFNIPWVDTVRLITVQKQKRRYQQLEAYSRDQQPANLTVSVTFVVSNPSVVYQQYGDLEGAIMRLIDPRVMSEVKSIFGQYDAVRAIQERVGLNNDFASAVTTAITAAGPINIISVQIENIDFSEAYEQSVEQRMLAQVEIQRREQNLRTVEVEAQIARTRAEGEAEAIRLRGEAEGAAIRARAEALRSNADLVQLQAVEKWDGKLPTTMVPSTALPFIDLQPAATRND